MQLAGLLLDLQSRHRRCSRLWSPAKTKGEPTVLHRPIAGMGRAERYMVTIADDDRTSLDKLCKKLIAAGATCDVLRNTFGKS